jgi:hypothetical protein
MSVEPSEVGTWLKPAGDVFLGLNASAVIRRVVGVIKIVPGLSVLQIQGLTWQQFVKHYADESAREGLNAAWLAMAEKRVARAYWPPYLPFKSGVIVRLRPIEDDPIITFVAHLSTVGEYERLNALIGSLLPDVMDRTIRIGQHLFRGVDGPLTDLQVKDVGGMINSAELTRQLLEDLRAAVLLPAVAAPQPHSLGSLFAFSARDFSSRRITTQRLTIRTDLSPDTVYCHDTIRDVTRRTLDTLLTMITAQTAITVSSTAEEETVQVEIEYSSQEPAFQVTQRIEPLDLSDPARLETMSLVQRSVTAAQACLKPVSGRAWAEPYQGAMRMVLVLPRWKGTLPEKREST